MPIGYYPALESVRGELAEKYSDWMRPGASLSQQRKTQKRQEMELADLVLAPSNFVADTIRTFHPHKHVVLAPYGVDLAA